MTKPRSYFWCTDVGSSTLAYGSMSLTRTRKSSTCKYDRRDNLKQGKAKRSFIERRHRSHSRNSSYYQFFCCLQQNF